MDYNKLIFDIQKEAITKGELLYFVTQKGLNLDKEFPDLVREDMLDGVNDLEEGICAGLALHWLSLRYHDLDFRTHLEPMKHMPGATRHRPGHVAVASPAIRQAVVNQLIVQRVAHNSDLLLGYVDAVLTSQYGISVNRKAFRNRSGTISAAFLQDEVHRSGDGLYYIGMRRTDGGGHAITIQHENAFYRLFDGNTGSYRFKSSERLFSFLKSYLDEYIYTQLCTEATWVGKIEPRERVLSHHDKIDWYKRRNRGFIDVPASRDVTGPTFLRSAGRPGRTPAYAGGW